MSKRVAFFDVDQTLVKDFSGITFLEFAAKNDLFDKEQLNILLKARKDFEEGTIDYIDLSGTWGETIAKGLKGKKQEDLRTIAKSFWSEIEPKFPSWVTGLISLFNNEGFTTIAVSGSNEELLDLYKERLGFTQVFATELEVVDGVYTGNMSRNLVLDEEKNKVIDAVSRDNDIDFDSSYGFGDSEHDRSFLDRVGNPVAVNPGKRLREHAEKNGWLIFEMSDNVKEEIQRLLIQ